MLTMLILFSGCKLNSGSEVSPVEIPTILLPTEQEVLSSDHPTQTMTWDRVKNASHYQVQITDDDFSNTIYDEVLNEIEYSTTLHSGFYKWRVRAFNSANAPGDWAYSEFSIDYFIKTFNTIFSNRYNNPVSNANAFGHTEDKGFLLLTYKQPTLENKAYPHLMRLNKTGDTIWENSLKIEGHYFPHSVNETSDHNIIILAEYKINGELRLVLSKLNAQGEMLWSKDFLHLSDRPYYQILIEEDGFLLVTLEPNNEMTDIAVLIKLDSDGDELWRYNPKTEDDKPFDYIVSLQRYADQYVMIGEANNKTYIASLDQSLLEFSTISTPSTANVGGYVSPNGNFYTVYSFTPAPGGGYSDYADVIVSIMNAEGMLLATDNLFYGRSGGFTSKKVEIFESEDRFLYVVAKEVFRATWVNYDGIKSHIRVATFQDALQRGDGGMSFLISSKQDIEDTRDYVQNQIILLNTDFEGNDNGLGRLVSCEGVYRC